MEYLAESIFSFQLFTISIRDITRVKVYIQQAVRYSNYNPEANLDSTFTVYTEELW